MTQPDIAPNKPPKRKRLSSEARRQDFINQAIEFFAEEGQSANGFRPKRGVRILSIRRLSSSRKKVLRARPAAWPRSLVSHNRFCIVIFHPKTT